MIKHKYLSLLITKRRSIIRTVLFCVHVYMCVYIVCAGAWHMFTQAHGDQRTACGVTIRNIIHRDWMLSLELTDWMSLDYQ